MRVGIRPEDLHLEAPGGGFPLAVEVVEALGAVSYVYGKINLPDGSDCQLILRTEARAAPSKGSIVHVSITAGHLHAFDFTTGERLGG